MTTGAGFEPPTLRSLSIFLPTVLPPLASFSWPIVLFDRRDVVGQNVGGKIVWAPFCFACFKDFQFNALLNHPLNDFQSFLSSLAFKRNDDINLILLPPGVSAIKLDPFSLITTSVIEI